MGDDAPHGRVTVQPDFWLRETGYNVGSFSRGPVRWFQRADNRQFEVEIPTVEEIHIDRSLDTDASACTIVLSNQWMYVNGEMHYFDEELGRPGYFTFSRGESPEAVARWGHSTNVWNNILVPNALLRTYQGFGGRDKSLSDALNDGNLIQTGLWIVDEVSIGTDGRLTLECRDMGKLLIEQQLYPPLVPPNQYPVKYSRWLYNEETGERIPYSEIINNEQAFWFPVSMTVNKSGNDLWDGDLQGHEALFTLDKNADTYWISHGNETANSIEFIEFDVGEPVNLIGVHPFSGNYQVYISVLEEGVWADGEGVIPYDPGATGRYTEAYQEGYGAEIPYVMQFGVEADTGRLIFLPRTYRAQRIRVTFANMVTTQWGPETYRCGLREFAAGLYERAATRLGPSVPAGTTKYSGSYPEGYWLLAETGQVHDFGALPNYGWDSAPWVINPAADITSTVSGNGYWVILRDGTVKSFGDAVDHGSPGPYSGITAGGRIGIERAPDGGGYWTVGLDGTVTAHGSATFQGNHLTVFQYLIDANDMWETVWCVGMTSDGTNNGYWTLSNYGTVRAHGSAIWYGEPFGTNDPFLNRQNRNFRTIVAHPVNPQSGYWVMDHYGRVWAYGACGYFGEARGSQGAPSGDFFFSDMIPTPSGAGYWLIGNGLNTLFTGNDGGQGGSVWAFGDAIYYGGTNADYAVQVRGDGNYKDYTEIVGELLLWSGWFLWESLDPFTKPSVFGNLESTGIWSEEPLPDDMFDKRPVIDAINAIKEIVGYIFFIDDIGAVRFELPNIWQPGNFYEDGTPTTFIPEIDEALNLTGYGITFNDRTVRSEIIISSSDPTAALSDTVTTRYIPPNVESLKGIVRSALWVNEVFTRKEEQEIMAQLIALYGFLAQRQSQATCVANPAIQINDQVRIYERQTAETYIHYVRGLTSDMDLNTGTYEMTLTTHWMGDGSTTWAVDIPRDVSDLPEELANQDQIVQEVLDFKSSLPSRLEPLVGTIDSYSGGSLNTVPPPTTSPGSPPGSPGAGTGAIDIRNTGGLFLGQGGQGFWNNAWHLARVVSQFDYFLNDRIFWFRVNVQQSSNAWAHFVNTETRAPNNRTAVVWVEGSGSGTITVNGQTTGSLAYNATAAQVESALEGLAGVGAGNVRVAGNSLNQGMVVGFIGSLTGIDRTISVSGTGWNVRTFYLRPCIGWQPYYYTNSSGESVNIAWPSGTFEQKVPTWTTNLGYLANKGGGDIGNRLWQNIETQFSYMAGSLGNGYFDRVWFEPIFESVGSTWFMFNAYGGADLYRQAYKNLHDGITATASQYGVTPIFGYNITANLSRSDQAIWEAAYPGNNYVDLITMDTYPSGDSETTAKVSSYKSMLFNKVTPFIEARGRGSGLPEYATAGGITGGATADNPNNWGQALYEWVQAECNSDRFFGAMYFDTSFTDSDHSFDSNPLSLQLYLQTFG